MKKFVLTLLILTSVTGTLVSCGSTSTSANGTTIKQNFATKPHTIAEDYAKAILDGDYDKALTMLNLEEGSIYTANDLQQSFTSQNIIPVDAKNIKAIKNKSDSTSKDILVNYEVKNENGKAQKKLLSVPTILTTDDKWAVDVSSNLVTDWKFSVPKGAILKIDGIEVTAPKTESLSNNTNTIKQITLDNYTIPAISNREHTLTVEHPTCDTFTKKFNPKDKISFSLKASEDFKTKTLEFVKNTRQDILDSAKANKPFDDFKKHFASDASMEPKQKNYDILKAYLNGGFEANSVKKIYSEILYDTPTISDSEYKGNNKILVVFAYKLTTSNRSVVANSVSYDFPNSSVNSYIQVLFKIDDDGSLKISDEVNFINPISI